MTDSIFLTRVVLRQYKSIAGCDVRLGPLTCLLGPNGSGKSNCVDALRLVRDALSDSLDNALSRRGGGREVVNRRFLRHSLPYGPIPFGIRLEFILSDKRAGFYAFQVSPFKGVSGVLNEECRIGTASGGGPFFQIQQGEVKGSSEDTFPRVTGDRLGLVAASGLTAFRPVFNALTSMAFYDPEPKMMRSIQWPQNGQLLKSSDENIASVFRELERSDSESLRVIQEYLHSIVPMVQGVQHTQAGPAETLEFL